MVLFITYTMSSFPKAASDMRLVNAAAPWFRALAAGPLGMAGRRRRGGEESRQTEAASARESNERRAKERALAFGRSALQSRSGAPCFPHHAGTSVSLFSTLVDVGRRFQRRIQGGI